MEKVLTKEEFMGLVYKDIERKESKAKGAIDAERHMYDNINRINKRTSKYKGRYRNYD